jgi:D-inositol-3-phosphate glycosyltransferase
VHPRLLILDPGNFTPSYDVNLALALIDRGWDITWVTSPHQFDEIPAFEGLRVQKAFFVHLRRLPLDHPTFSNPTPILIRRTAKGISYPIDLVKLHSRMCRQEPGIIHVQWALLPSLDIVFWKKWRQRGWVVVFTAHDPKPLAGTTPKLFWRRAADLCREADAVIVHGRYAHRELCKLKVDEGRIHIMAPGPTLIGPPSDRAEARHALGLDMNAPVVLFFGYIKQYKGLHILLESLPLVEAELGKVTLLVAGELMEPRARYQRLISRLDLEGEVRWSDGYVPDRASSLYFAAADLVALPYLQASSSAVLLTAYVCRRPVVASSVGGIPEQIEDGESGYLVPPGDPIALAAALARTLRNPQLAERMGARGYQLIEEKFAWNDIAESSEALYLQLWNKGK